MTGVRLYTNEDVTGLGERFLAPGIPKGEKRHGF
jgi:hypothetical protein